MSPRTSTWTEILGSLADPESVTLGGECRTYRVGSSNNKTVNEVEAITATVRSISSIAERVRGFLGVWANK
jgi:hypothetical protein